MQQLFESEEHSENIFKRIPDRTCVENAKKATPTIDEDINQSIWRALEKEVQNKVQLSLFLNRQLPSRLGVQIDWI